MQAIKINNRVFNSIARAAKFLQMPRVTLSAKMKDKKAIVHKDLLIEKLDKPKEKKTINKRKGTPVIVDGVAYNNCREAEKALGLPNCVLAKTLRMGKSKYNGHSVEPVFPSAVKNTKRVGVFCESNGRTYDSILEAARAAGVDSWTMSKKMETSGSFVDDLGRVYKRLQPMKTKNTYKNPGSAITIKRPFVHRKVKQTPVVETKPTDTKQTVPQIVRDAINDKIITLLKEKGVYDDIIDLLNYGGFTSVKFNPKQND